MILLSPRVPDTTKDTPIKIGGSKARTLFRTPISDRQIRPLYTGSDTYKPRGSFPLRKELKPNCKQAAYTPEPQPFWEKAKITASYILGTSALVGLGVGLGFLCKSVINPSNLQICPTDLTSDVPIVSFDLSGGLGNQMFRVATVYAHALDIGGKAMFSQAKIDHLDTNSSPLFRKLEFYPANLSHCYKKNILKENGFDEIELPKHIHASLHLEGHFFSARYFDHRRKEILELFRPSQALQVHLNQLYHNIENAYPGKETVAIHIRRGDYTTIKAGKEHENVFCSLSDETDYYKKALELFKDKDKYHFVIFSDDLEYAKNMNEFKDLHKTFFKGEDHEDLYLMSMCRHQIMANSTFSWWGAYLRENPNQIVTYPVNAFWGPHVTRQKNPPRSHIDSLGKCSRGFDYFLMDHWKLIE